MPLKNKNHEKCDSFVTNSERKDNITLKSLIILPEWLVRELGMFCKVAKINKMLKVEH